MSFKVQLCCMALLSLCFLLMGCSGQPEKSIDNRVNYAVLQVPDRWVKKSALKYNPKTSLWTLNDARYSGFVVSYYPDNSLKEKFGILNGKKQNRCIQLYPDGHFKSLSEYDKGKLHGEKKIWSSDALHILVAHYHFKQGKPHGKQTKWYPTGELFKKMNLNMGKEEGLQQAFRKNGVLFANYEAREGRIFGLKKAKLCYSLEDETVQQKTNKSTLNP